MSKEKNEGILFSTMQKVGRSFFLPVSILPIAGLLLGIGASLTNQGTITAYNLEGLLGEGTILNVFLTILSQVGSTIFGNLPIIFAMAVALGMAKQEKAVATLSAAISFFVMHTTINALLQADGSILADGSISENVLDGALTNVVGITSLETGVFGGIVIGLIVAALHNRFYKQQLPTALSFFSGVRFVPIISVLVSILVGIAFYFVWPVIQNGIFAAGGLVTKSGYFGTFIFGFLERALIPFGLHHVFYIPFWQTALGGTAVIDGLTVVGAQNIYFAELASPNTVKFSVEACRFMTGKYAVMMAGLPGAAYAMYKCARPENRKEVGGLLFSAALTSFLTGITEPIEFTFLFIAPSLFVLHCVFAGISFVISHLLSICIGTTFSCGLIDFILYGPLQGNAKSNWVTILPVFLIYAVGYYLVFKYLIKKFNIPTPGREEASEGIKLYTKDDFQTKEKRNGTAESDTLSPNILRAIGGLSNLVDIDACATRLRLTVKDSEIVDENLLKANGAKGVIKKGTGLQIIYGPEVSIIKSNFEEYVESIEASDTKTDPIEKIESPLSGEIVALEDVNDPSFSQKMLGDGIAVFPKSGKVYAPFDGTVKVMFQTGHAIGLESELGNEILIHIGLETVKLEGEGFSPKVQTGDKIIKGQLLLEFDMDTIQSKGYDIITPIVVTNLTTTGRKVYINKDQGVIHSKELLFELQ